MRIFLTGPVRVEHGDVSIDEHDFGGRQVRLLFAYLVIERHRPIPRTELAELLWPAIQPLTWQPALRGLVSKVRTLLCLCGASRTDTITYAFGCYRLHLPPATWVDLEVAGTAVEEAERQLRDDQPDLACEAAQDAVAFTRPPFLPGEDGPWAESQRRQLERLRLRALRALSESRLLRGELELAVVAAEDAVDVAPFSDSIHRQLMLAHVAAGDRANALLEYERCRVLLADELGVDPSPEMQALYLQLLREPGLLPDVASEPGQATARSG